MSARDNGGPAFPVDEIDQALGHVCVQHMGMTLRDYFAAHAPTVEIEAMSLEDHADYRYRYADAMLKARAA